MTPAEINKWLGMHPDADLTATRTGRAVLRRLADLPVPAGDNQEVSTFAAFLSVAGPPGVPIARRRYQCPIKAVPR